MSNLENKFAILARKAVEEQPSKAEPDLPAAGFADVVREFVDGLGQLDFLDCHLRKNDADSSLWHVRVAPRYRLSENNILLSLCATKINGKDVVAVLGEREIVFADPAGLNSYLVSFLDRDNVRDWLSELKARYEGDADGILRCRSLYNLTADDAVSVVPQASFLDLAKAPPGAAITIRVDVGRSQVYAPDRTYKFLTSSGHVLEIASIAPTDDKGVVLVTGKKSSAMKRAA